MKRLLFVLIVVFILFLVVLIEVNNVRKTQKIIGSLKNEEINYMTIVYENNETTITSDDGKFNEKIKKLDEVLFSQTEPIKETFMWGDAQDILKIIITKQNKSNFEITFAYSYTKELCRISVATGSVENIFKIVNLSEPDFKSLTIVRK